MAQDRFLTIIGDQARRMSRLVDDLLSLSRIEQSSHLQPTSIVDLSSIAGHVVDTLAPMADENETQVVLRAEEPVLVRGDRDELVRVAENLIENAIKYGASDNPVEVTVSPRDRASLVSENSSRMGSNAFRYVSGFARGVRPIGA